MDNYAVIYDSVDIDGPEYDKVWDFVTLEEARKFVIDLVLKGEANKIAQELDIRVSEYRYQVEYSNFRIACVEELDIDEPIIRQEIQDKLEEIRAKLEAIKKKKDENYEAAVKAFFSDSSL